MNWPKAGSAWMVPVAMADVEAPMFVVGTEHDHVAPWKSAYKLHLLTHNALTFVLTSGGHNAGVVSSRAQGSPLPCGHAGAER
jgi:poly(3-hydroxyalkanoate) synthetase